MRKSALVSFGVIMSALILGSCNEERRCVDANGNVVEDSKCRDAERRPTYGGHGGGFYWYYGGTRGGLGSRISGGSYSPVSRGGFGRLAFLHGFAHA